MKVFLKILKVLGAFLASLITPLLVAALMLAPVANTVSSVFTGEIVAKLVTNLDFEELKVSNEVFKETFENSDITPEEFEAIIKSDTFVEILEYYTEDLTEIMAGNRDESEFTPEALKEIISDNMDEVVGAVKENVSEAKDMTYSEIEDDILTAIDESGEELVKVLPKAEDMKEMVNDLPGVSNVGGVIKFMQKSLMPIVYGVIAGLALLIFLFRISKFNGLLWDGIIFTGCSVLMFIVTFGFEAIMEALDEKGIIGLDTSTPFISSFEGIFLPFAIAYAIIGVLFIGGFIALCVLRRSKQKKLALAAVAAEAAVANEAPVAEATTEAAEAETADEAADETAEEAPAPEEAEETEKTEEAEVK